ncbi:biotin--[acetyl-CoA-carboxylase] ligase [Helicobacter pametensis]|uniref:biotin--[acetyl-CoA-carboxylase] ligase n=1 Tax=Helicobacter pametensis TaxID=95149 RepID=UPI000484CA9F|nr:biotin--[acetyl-CoA-carboxylase] ligase [Helicobacter pametensis]
MNFFCFKELVSTQTWLVDQVKNQVFTLPACVMSERQIKGVGSRNNSWESVENALLFSFAFKKAILPSDLPLQSISIYVGYLFKEWLNYEGLWLKWPNDLYLGDFKVGGVLTQSLGDQFVCGVGLNLYASSYASLSLDWDFQIKQEKLREFLDFFFRLPSWDDIFWNYKLEFHKNFGFTFHFNDQEMSFCNASLCEDGSLLVGNQKIYSLR